MKDHEIKGAVLLFLLLYAIQMYYHVRLSLLEIEMYEEDRNREWTDWFTEDKK